MDAEVITLKLREFAAGDKSALDEVLPLVYQELHRLAKRHLDGERREHTLQATGLVHEAYVRMIGQAQPDYRNRAHFLAIAARVMRQILIDHARSRSRGKRGGGAVLYPLDEALDAAVERPTAMLAIDDALQALESRHPLRGQLIEMRFFGGLTAEESAEVLNLPVEKVRGELRLAQAWLQRELDRSQAAGA